MNDERNVKDDGLDPGATGAVRLMRDRRIDARTPATRARSFRTLGTRLGAMRERARKRKLAAIGVSCVAIAAAIGFGARSRLDVGSAERADLHGQRRRSRPGRLHLARAGACRADAVVLRWHTHPDGRRGARQGRRDRSSRRAHRARRRQGPRSGHAPRRRPVGVRGGTVPHQRAGDGIFVRLERPRRALRAADGQRRRLRHRSRVGRRDRPARRPAAGDRSARAGGGGARRASGAGGNAAGGRRTARAVAARRRPRAASAGLRKRGPRAWPRGAPI